ncbi:hypothetical protein LXA43DRAFT_1117783, partial [Ganoderma leucocontextum]
MVYYLCVDCSRSKPAAAIADINENVLGRTVGGPSNFAYLGLPNFMHTITATISSALQSFLLASEHRTPLLPADKPFLASTWFGVSRVDSGAASLPLIPSITPLLGIEAIIVNVTHLLASPLGMYDDITAAPGCVSGMGVIVVSFQQVQVAGLEELGRVGGWGLILGEEGGGFHVGREAVRQNLWDADCALVVTPEKRNT